MRFRIITVLLLAGFLPQTVASNDLDPWPAAQTDEKRMVFRIPALENENDLRVEILVGKQFEVDCNGLHLSGNLDRISIQGWGYPLYKVTGISPGMTTMMACPELEPRTAQFITVQGEGYMQRYNSKLPYVIYVPTEFEVEYRIWSSGESNPAIEE
jgi:ecotin